MSLYIKNYGASEDDFTAKHQTCSRIGSNEPRTSTGDCQDGRTYLTSSWNRSSVDSGGSFRSRQERKRSLRAQKSGGKEFHSVIYTFNIRCCNCVSSSCGPAQNFS